MKKAVFDLVHNQPAQSNFIHDFIGNLNGVKSVTVNNNAKKVIVEYDENQVTPYEIESTLRYNNFI